ncbi:MAG TPA: M50 family metallopeptidase, partial [Ferruginibacter sp.]|nr:M50 family metallopeptidase [Ferruginibacter sp.]
GKQSTIRLQENMLGQLATKKKEGVGFIDIRKPVIVGDMSDKGWDTSYAKVAGLKHFDKVLSVDSTPVTFYDEMLEVLDKHKNGAVTVNIRRDGRDTSVVSKVNDEGRLGMPLITVGEMDSLGMLKIDTTKYSFFASFPAGVAKTGEKLSNYIDQFKKIVNPKTEGYKAVGGFKRIASIFPVPWDWEAFWSITAFLSVMLAFMNLLPIPALDGGHVLFTLIEMITGRKPSEKFLEYAQVVGMVILLALMLYANGNDWFGWGKGK